VNVHEIGIGSRPRDAEQSARDAPDLSRRGARARGQDFTAARDQYLPQARALETPDQKLGLPLAASVTPRNVDVSDRDWHQAARAPLSKNLREA
jgi:hypothetical protein